MINPGIQTDFYITCDQSETSDRFLDKSRVGHITSTWNMDIRSSFYGLLLPLMVIGVEGVVGLDSHLLYSECSECDTTMVQSHGCGCGRDPDRSTSVSTYPSRSLRDTKF